MGALIDSVAGGYTGDEENDGVGDSSGSYFVQSPVPQQGTNYGAGLVQTMTALGTGYLARRMDVDLQRRVAGAQPLPQLGTTQNAIGGYGSIVRTPQGQQVAAINLSAMMPLALVAGLAFFLARRGG